MKFSTNRSYFDRESKSEYIFDKYKNIFDEEVLDVGADAMYLKPRLEGVGVKYCGIGFGEGIDIEHNLEVLPYPFQDKAFKTVVCFDVLEHLECIHDAFNELCRLSRDYVVVSLPNPWADFFNVLLSGDYSESENLKFYGLPMRRPLDRHRWFFGEREAVSFINYKAQENGFSLVQFDTRNQNKKLGEGSFKGFIGRFALRSIFRKDIGEIGLHHSTLWFVLKRN